VDVPGHDRLVGNMLVGAGEVDAALLVVAADDGPNAQTLEHLELLDALAIDDGVVAVTKTDLVSDDRAAEVGSLVDGLLARTSLAGSPVVVVSAVAGTNLEALRDAIATLQARVAGRTRTATGGARLAVDRVFAVKGRGTVATGRIERGTVKVGEEVEMIGIKPTRKVVVTGVEMFNKLLDAGQAGDNIGCLLRGIERDEIERGQVLAATGSIKPHTRFTARVYVLTKEEGGRHTPFYNGYRPQFYLRTTDVTGAISLKDGAEMIMPGDHVDMDVELITPIALEVGQRFAIREGGRTVGAGAVIAVED